MSPNLLLADLRKLERDVPVYVTHRKPGFESDVEAALPGAWEGTTARAGTGLWAVLRRVGSSIA